MAAAGPAVLGSVDPGMGATCGGDLTDDSTGLGLRIGAIFAIAAVSTIGGLLPFIFRTARLSVLFHLGTLVAAGVVLGVGMVHVLPDAVTALTNPCLELSGEYPWAYVFAGTFALITLTLEMALRGYIFKRMGMSGIMTQVQAGACDHSIEAGPRKGEVDPVALEKQEAAEVAQAHVIAIVLESGMIFHSIFIGIDLGIQHDPSTARALMIALMFHQGFEGLALGSAFLRAKFSTLKYMLFLLAFVLITPIGTVIGIAMGNSYNDNSKTALGFEGAFNSASAGILIYNALVDLIVPAFATSERVFPNGGIVKIVPFLCLYLGFAIMSLIAKWA